MSSMMPQNQDYSSMLPGMNAGNNHLGYNQPPSQTNSTMPSGAIYNNMVPVPYPPNLYSQQGYSQTPFNTSYGPQFQPIRSMPVNSEQYASPYQSGGHAQVPPVQQQQSSFNPPVPKERERKILQIRDPDSKKLVDISNKPGESVPKNDLEKEMIQKAILERLVNSRESRAKGVDVTEKPSEQMFKVQDQPAVSTVPNKLLHALTKHIAAQPADVKIQKPVAQLPEVKIQKPVAPPVDFLDTIEELKGQLAHLNVKNEEALAKQEYSFEFLDLISKIIKHDKNPLLPEQADLLKQKKVDLDSEEFQMQNSSKHGASSSANKQNKYNKPSALNALINPRNKSMHDGRQNNNKVRDKWHSDHSSFNRKVRQPSPSLPPASDLRKAENAWKPKRRETPDASAENKNYAAVSKEIRSILNKITPTTFDELIQEFFEIDVNQDGHYQQVAIDLIFGKAVEEPTFCSMYTELCKRQIDRNKRTTGSFFHTLVLKVQSTFGGDSELGKNIKKLEEESVVETDEVKKSDLEERIDVLKKKETRNILGNIRFISHLYVAGIVMDHVVSSCLSKLHIMFDETKDETFVQYGIELLEKVCKLYFSKKRKDERETKGESSINVTSFINWLSTDEVTSNVSTKIKVMIMNFKDFSEAGYVKRTADSGPKTIQQIHADIQKEKEAKQAEHEEYQARKKWEQRQQDRGYRQNRGHHDRYAPRYHDDYNSRKNFDAKDKSMNTGWLKRESSNVPPASSLQMRDGGTKSFKSGEKNEHSSPVKPIDELNVENAKDPEHNVEDAKDPEHSSPSKPVDEFNTENAKDSEHSSPSKLADDVENAKDSERND